MRQLPGPLYLPKNFVSLYKDVPFCIFDIETTGLNPAFNKVILAGMCYVENDQIIIKQLFCKNRKKEYNLLSCLKENLSQFDLLISYNGNAFDIPFLNKRFAIHKIDYQVQSFKNLDLLQFVKKIKHLVKLNDYKLKTLEKYLNIHRTDTISGKESVELYSQFEKTLQPALKKTILLHNHDDLFYMSKTLSILDKVPYEEISAYVPQLIQIHGKPIYIVEKKIKNSTLYITGYCEIKNCPEYILYENSFDFQYILPNFTMKVPLYKRRTAEEYQYLYIDTKEFSFCNIHSSLKNSKAENMLILKSGNNIKYKNVDFFVQKILEYVFLKVLGKDMNS